MLKKAIYNISFLALIAAPAMASDTMVNGSIMFDDGEVIGTCFIARGPMEQQLFETLEHNQALIKQMKNNQKEIDNLLGTCPMLEFNSRLATAQSEVSEIRFWDGSSHFKIGTISTLHLSESPKETRCRNALNNLNHTIRKEREEGTLVDIINRLTSQQFVWQ